MARREITQYFDDIDGTSLTEDQVNTVRLLEVLAAYVEAAQPAPVARQSRTRAAGGAKHSNSRRIREWAEAQNIKAADRGAIPKHIVEAYNQAHPA